MVNALGVIGWGGPALAPELRVGLHLVYAYSQPVQSPGTKAPWSATAGENVRGVRPPDQKSRSK